jgi:hypothetical protein
MPKRKANLTVIDLERLTQSQLAWLLNRSPQWLRANANLFHRDAQGRYSGRQAVAALMATRTGYVTPPELLHLI